MSSSLPDWSERRVWLFDLDGTLTVPVHDFMYARRELGIDPEQDILTALAERSPSDRAAAERWLRQWELDLAAESRLQDDAAELVAHLSEAGCRLGVLTRNTRDVAFRTLDAIGLRSVMHHDDAILGRDSARPKPHPDGILLLLQRLDAAPDQAVMVGDYLHDVRAGRAAGTATVLVCRHRETGWDDEADLVVGSLWPLSARLPAPDAT
ncbi:MAG: HAD family hydrolase [Deltaproteobacteria bacterium]|nr:HAD family hydrolase [Deltaproteobacteria bacterium]HCH65015.1 HAD family hydrolase [Deltaproteobacteria bacterium]